MEDKERKGAREGEVEWETIGGLEGEEVWEVREEGVAGKGER